MNKISRDIKRRILTANSEIIRFKYKALIARTKDKPRQLFIHEKLDKLSRNSSKTRIKNFCILTSRSKGIYKNFGISRIMFRELALLGQLPGIKKASW